MRNSKQENKGRKYLSPLKQKSLLKLLLAYFSGPLESV